MCTSYLLGSRWLFFFFFLCNTPVTFLELFISCLRNARGNWIGQLVVKRNSAFDTLAYYLCWLSFVISFGCCTCPYICAPKWNLVCSSDSEFLNICPTMANTRIYIYMNLYESTIVSAGKYKLPNNYLSLSLSAYFPKKKQTLLTPPFLFFQSIKCLTFAICPVFTFKCVLSWPFFWIHKYTINRMLFW